MTQEQQHRRDFARLFRGKDGDWYFTSEGHRNKQDAIDVIEAHYAGSSIVEPDQFAQDDDGA